MSCSQAVDWCSMFIVDGALSGLSYLLNFPASFHILMAWSPIATIPFAVVFDTSSSWKISAENLKILQYSPPVLILNEINTTVSLRILGCAIGLPLGMEGSWTMPWWIRGIVGGEMDNAPFIWLVVAFCRRGEFQLSKIRKLSCSKLFSVARFVPAMSLISSGRSSTSWSYLLLLYH